MEPGRPPAKPPTDNGGPTTFNNPFPYGDPTGNGGTTFGNPPPPFGNPIIPPTGTGGTGTGGGGSTLVGLDALIDTLRSRNLHAQADAILVADLYQRNAVVTDPMTGQLRQYADAVFSSGSDGIKFINATMIAGVPNSLNYTTSLIRFNQPLPAAYWTATQTAFVGGSTPPSWYAVRYLTDISNTVDHLMVDASGGSSFLDTMTSRYVTHFTDIQTSINGIVLWAKNSGGTTYLGGATPTTSVMSTPHADHEVKNTYSDGTYVTVRTMFADDQGTIASMASKPTTMSASSYLDNLNVRTMIRSNLLSKGSLDIFGTAKGRRLSGLMTYDDGEAAAILNGTQSPLGAPIGLLPS